MRIAVDQELFDRFVELSSAIPTARWRIEFNRANTVQRERFFADSEYVPTFNYENIELQPDATDRIDQFLKYVEQSSVHRLVKDLYVRKAGVFKKQVALDEYAKLADDEGFFKTCINLYGLPKTKYAEYVRGRVAALCQQTKDLVPQDAARVSQVLQRHDVESGENYTFSRPTDAPSPVVNDFDRVLQIAEEKFKKYGIEGWEIRVGESTGAVRFSVWPVKRTLFIPAAEHLFSRPHPLTENDLHAVLEHEIGVHVRRGFEASKTPLRLLEIGLPGYLEAEEGLAGYMQNQQLGASEFYGFDRYFAICLATGAFGEKRNFTEVFAIMQSFYSMKKALLSENKSDNPQLAAWNACARIFRGTSGKTPGCVFSKDILYLEGNMQVSELVESHPTVLPLLFVGKFSPFIKDHVSVLQDLEILPNTFTSMVSDG